MNLRLLPGVDAAKQILEATQKDLTSLPWMSFFFFHFVWMPLQNLFTFSIEIFLSFLSFLFSIFNFKKKWIGANTACAKECKVKFRGQLNASFTHELFTYSKQFLLVRMEVCSRSFRSCSWDHVSCSFTSCGMDELVTSLQNYPLAEIHST